MEIVNECENIRNRNPEHLCDERAVRFNEPFVLRARTGGGVFWALSADCAAKGSKLIDRDYDLPKTSVEGHIHTDQRKMRRGLIMRECEHLNDLRRRFPGAKQLASIGNGNLLANIGFVAWSRGVLFCLQPEPVFQKRYTAVVSWKDGKR